MREREREREGERESEREGERGRERGRKRERKRQRGMQVPDCMIGMNSSSKNACTAFKTVLTGIAVSSVRALKVSITVIPAC
jgi:hypothetical protein